jgi:hypothetical protein
MFAFFKKKKNNCPVSEDVRLWLENSLIWLIQQFGENKIRSVKTLLPLQKDFPAITFNGSEQMAHDLLSVVAKQMDTDPEKIKLDFYNEQLLEIRAETGFTLFGQQYEDQNYSSGLYAGKNANDKYSIGIEIGQLKQPDKIIATLAHEIAHIKILGEGRLKQNDEFLTDLTTVFFGLGIFNANSSFQQYSSSDGWAYSTQGYLPQQDWGYALALYAYIRQEKKPDWVRHLTPNIRSDFKKSEAYIYDNTDKVLV